MGLSLKQLHYQDCLWLSLFYFWLLKVFDQKEKKNHMNAGECLKPFLKIIRTAGNVWPDFGWIVLRVLLSEQVL